MLKYTKSFVKLRMSTTDDGELTAATVDSVCVHVLDKMDSVYCVCVWCMWLNVGKSHHSNRNINSRSRAQVVAAAARQQHAAHGWPVCMMRLLNEKKLHISGILLHNAWPRPFSLSHRIYMGK